MASPKPEGSAEYKKKILNKHIPFVEKTLKKVKDTAYEKKWKNTMSLIVSDQGMSVEQVHQLDKKLEDLKATVGFSNEPKETRKSPVKTTEKRTETRSSLSRRSTDPKQNSIKENDQKSPKKDHHAAVTRSSPKSSRSRHMDTETVETRRHSSRSSTSSTQHKEEKSTEADTNDLKQLLSSISISEEQPEKSLKAIEKILGSENLLKLQNLLLKGIIMKSISGTEQQTSKEQKPTEQQSASEVEPSEGNEGQIKEPPKKKRPQKNELEKLYEYNNDIYDGEDVLRVGQRARACMLKTSEKITQCFERESGPIVPKEVKSPSTSTSKKAEANLFSKHKLKKCSVALVKLNITKKDVPLLVDNSMNEDYINKNKSKLQAYLEESSSSSIDREVKIKEEPFIPEAVTETKSKTNIRSVAKKRVRNQWSRGVIKTVKRKAEKQDDWEDVENAKKKTQYVTGMNLDASTAKIETEAPKLDESNDPLVKMMVSAAEKSPKPLDSPLSSLENMDMMGDDEDNLLEEIPSSPDVHAEEPKKNAEPEVKSIPEKQPSPVPEPSPKPKIGMIKCIPQARLMEPQPPSITMSDNENIVSPTPKLIGLVSPTTAVIRPLPQTPSSSGIKPVTILPKPQTSNAQQQQQQVLIPNPLQQLARLDFLPRSGTTQTPQLTNVPIPKNVQPIRRLSIITPQQINTFLQKPKTPQPPAEPPIPVNIIAKNISSGSTIRKMSFVLPKPQEQTIILKQPDVILSVNQPTKAPEMAAPSTSTAILIPDDESPVKKPFVIPHKLKLTNVNSSSDDILRPWIEDSKCTKKRSTCEKMINQYCLAALYKCMATTCSFYSQDKHLFQIHVELHLKLQSKDSANCLMCAYCTHTALTIQGLTKHIESEHRFDLFSCSNCFYRTFNEYQMYLNHYPKYHEGKEKVVILLNDVVKKQPRSDLIFIKNTLGAFITPFTCIFPGCGKRYFVLEVFSEHLQSHKEKIATKCMKCNVETTPENIFEHYFNCYGFGMIQCVYCSFGTSTMQFIDDHLSVNHPSRAPYFAERMLSSSMKSGTVGESAFSSIESLTIKIMSKKLEGGTKIQVTDKEKLDNSQNIGNLSDEGNIEQKEDPQITLAPGTTLQINSVMSLNQSATN